MTRIRRILAWPFMVLGATLIVIGSIIIADTINFNGINLGGKNEQ